MSDQSIEQNATGTCRWNSPWCYCLGLRLQNVRRALDEIAGMEICVVDGEQMERCQTVC